jgi:hypothetical protein
VSTPAFYYYPLQEKVAPYSYDHIDIVCDGLACYIEKVYGYYQPYGRGGHGIRF